MSTASLQFSQLRRSLIRAASVSLPSRKVNQQGRVVAGFAPHLVFAATGIARRKVVVVRQPSDLAHQQPGNGQPIHPCRFRQLLSDTRGSPILRWTIQRAGAFRTPLPLIWAT